MGAHAQVASAHGVSDVRVEFDHPLIRFASHLVLLDGIVLVHGRNVASEDLVLAGEQVESYVALQVGLRGSASTRLEGLNQPLHNHGGSSELVVTPPGRYEVNLPGRTTNEAFRVNLMPAYFATLAERNPELAPSILSHVTSGTPAQLGGRQIAPLARVFEIVDDLMNSEHYGSLRRSFVESKVVELLVRHLVGEARSLRTEGVKSRDVDRMVEARDRLLTTIADPPTLQELARAVGTNEFKLKRDFKAVFHRSVYAFVLDRRLERAHALLVETDRPIKEIAQEAGYAHLSHFSTAFRKRYGLPPSRVRTPRR
jgi:AraC-like DNA-binding protein